MTDKTLYLIQSNYANTESSLQKLKQIYAQNDAVVLMGDAVLFHSSEYLEGYTKLYILDNDVEILSNQTSEQFKIISYTEFSDLILHFKRCISLK